jgi:hypothetical protein
MNKDEILQKINSKKYTHEQLVSWLNCLPVSNERRKPIEYKVGDVIMHGVFKHPYILLKKRKNEWLCGLFTTEENFPDILESCQSRFFINSYFVKSIFTATKIEGAFINTYGNNRHLTEVFKKLKEIIK